MCQQHRFRRAIAASAGYPDGGSRESVRENRIMRKSVDTTNVEHYIWGGVSDGWRLFDTPGLSVIEERVPAGAGVACA